MIVTDSQTTKNAGFLQNYEYVNKKIIFWQTRITGRISYKKLSFAQFRDSLRELEICWETSYSIKKKGHII